MSVGKIVIHTDVFLEHLCGDRHPSALREAMGRYFCYTTVFQAIELFGLARSERERRSVEDALSAMKLLGLNARSAPRYGELLSGRSRVDRWNLLIAGLCIESGLPLLTDRKKEFREFGSVKIIPTSIFGSGRKKNPGAHEIK